MKSSMVRLWYVAFGVDVPLPCNELTSKEQDGLEENLRWQDGSTFQTKAKTGYRTEYITF